MDLGLEGKTAFVAAASKGMGRACALGLAAEGARVALCARSEGPLREELEKLAEKLAVKPRVRFLGWREDTGALLATADSRMYRDKSKRKQRVQVQPAATGTDGLPAVSVPIAPAQEITEIDIQRAGFGVL